MPAKTVEDKAYWLKQEWFYYVNRLTYMWDRKSVNTLALAFVGYKSEAYALACDKLGELGGFVLTVTWDPLGGCTHVLIKEPNFKKLARKLP